MIYYILVCGGTTFNDYARLERVLDEEIPLALKNCPIGETITVMIVNGGARGADQLSTRYARSHQLAFEEIPAEWILYGKPAGPIRNTALANYLAPHVPYVAGIAFWDGYSPGTADMIKKAGKKGIPVRTEYY